MKYLEPLQFTQKVEVNEETYTETYGKFEIGPLEPGFATTIGNTIRRVLLSSIQGAAVKFVKIEGLHHQFEPIPGTSSDFIDLILRLKKLVLDTDSLQDERLLLECKGPKKVTAADIKETDKIKIINKDLFLIELTEDIEFRMELWVGSGRGYVPAEKHEQEEEIIGKIPIDSIYSPIKRANFEATNQRVGGQIDYDKLIMELETDGSIEAEKALYLSAKILRDLFNKLVLFKEEPKYIEEVEMDPKLKRLETLFDSNVTELELSVRCSNCLAAAKIEKIGELVEKTENEMLKYRNFGKKSLEEINELLKSYDLTLGMDVEGLRKKIEEAKNKVIISKRG